MHLVLCPMKTQLYISGAMFDLRIDTESSVHTFVVQMPLLKLVIY